MLHTMIFREHRYKENISEVKEELLNKINQNPKDIKSLEQLAQIYHAYKNNQKAIEIYKQLYSLEPENAQVSAYLGYLYYEENKLQDAEYYLSESLLIEPFEPFVLFLMGNVLSRRGRAIEAINYYETAVFYDFDIFTAHIDFARKYEHMGRHEKALQEFKTAYSIDPSDKGVLEKIKYLENKIVNK